MSFRRLRKLRRWWALEMPRESARSSSDMSHPPSSKEGSSQVDCDFPNSIRSGIKYGQKSYTLTSTGSICMSTLVGKSSFWNGLDRGTKPDMSFDVPWMLLSSRWGIPGCGGRGNPAWFHLLNGVRMLDGISVSGMDSMKDGLFVPPALVTTYIREN
jgi:hypothetical protein